MGWGLATFFLNRCKIAHTLLGRSCTLCFETVLGMNKITHTLSPPPKKISKQFFKIFFYFMIFVKNMFKGVELATLSFNRCNMAQCLLRRSWFKYLNITKKKKILNFFTIYLEKKLKYLILRSGKFGNLVTSFF